MTTKAILQHLIYWIHIKQWHVILTQSCYPVRKTFIFLIHSILLSFFLEILKSLSATFCCRICAGCNTEIGHGRFLSCMGAVWHPECFCCHACNQPISDYEVRKLIIPSWHFHEKLYRMRLKLTSLLVQFSMSGNYPYHKSCYKEHYHPKCDVCKQFVSI